MGYNLAGGEAIRLKQIANRNDLPAGFAILVDDLFHNTGLFQGSDTGKALERALALKGIPGGKSIVNTHIYVSMDGVSFSF